MKVLVTGGAGYIGSHTVKLLCARGFETFVVDDLSTGHAAAVDRRAHFQRGSIHDYDFLRQTLSTHGIEGVIHFAASLSVGESVRDPLKYWHNNLSGTAQLLRAMRDCGIRRLVFSSTAATYGAPAVDRISEACPQKPINPYGHSKLAMERAIQDCVHAHGLGAVSLRYFNAAGAALDGSLGEDHRPEEHLIPVILEVALGKRAEVRVFGTDFSTPDGTCVRDFIHVDDLARAHVLALERLAPGSYAAFNVATGAGHSVRSVIEVARRITGTSIPSVDVARREGDPPVLVADPTRIQQTLGWNPEIPELERIIESAWQWMKRHPQGYGTT
jgi:UDP-glucose-4-epimerase GalE